MKSESNRSRSDGRRKNMTRRIRFFTDFDLEAHREYLEDMSAKGLFFVRRSGIVYIFHKGMPKQQRYAVDLFSKSSSVGGGFINRETAEYIESCRECGWEHLDTEAGMQYFVAVGDDVTPIHTDPQVQLSAIRRSMRLWVASLLIMIAVGVLNIGTMMYPTSPTTLIETGNIVLLYIVSILFLTWTLLRYGIFLLRNRKPAAMGEELRFSSGKMVRLMERFVMAYVAVGIVLLIASLLDAPVIEMVGIGVLAATFGIIHGVSQWHGRRVQHDEQMENAHSTEEAQKDFWKKEDAEDFGRLADSPRKMSKTRLTVLAVSATIAVTAIICLVLLFAVDDGGKDSKGRLEYYDPVAETNVVQYVSSDVIPMTFQSLGIKAGGILPEQGEYVGSDTYGKRYRSLLGTVLDCSETGYSNVGEASYLEYNIAHCRFDWVRDSVLEEYKADGLFDDGGDTTDLTEREGALWDADFVYGASDDGYSARLVVWDKTLLFIESDRLEYTKEDIASITGNLKDELR